MNRRNFLMTTAGAGAAFGGCSSLRTKTNQNTHRLNPEHPLAINMWDFDSPCRDNTYLC